MHSSLQGSWSYSGSGQNCTGTFIKRKGNICNIISVRKCTCSGDSRGWKTVCSIMLRHNRAVLFHIVNEIVFEMLHAASEIRDVAHLWGTDQGTTKAAMKDIFLISSYIHLQPSLANITHYLNTDACSLARAVGSACCQSHFQGSSVHLLAISSHLIAKTEGAQCFPGQRV